MIRLQIIILFLTAFILGSLFSGQDKKDLMTDYDLRFVCSLELDIKKQPINAKIETRSDEEKLNHLVNTICSNCNSEIEIVGGLLRKPANNKNLLSPITIGDSYLKPGNSHYLHSPRSPPSLV